MSAEDQFSSINKQEPFYKAAKLVFDNWTALQLAVTHQFAGSSTKESAEWFLNATYQWIVENEDLEDMELEEFFDDTLNNEFNMLLEDNSAIQIARLLLSYRKLVKDGKLGELESETARRFPSNKKSQVDTCVRGGGGDEQSSSSEGEEDENNNDVDMNDAENSEAKSSGNKLTEQEMKNYEELEEGWTLVTKNGNMTK